MARRVAERDARDDDNLSPPPLANTVFAGEDAAANLAKQGILGPSNAIALAKRLRAKGASDDKIHTATSKILKGTPYAGVHFHHDGTPRFEITDHDAKVKSLAVPKGGSNYLGNVLDHPELYRAVPGASAATVEKATGPHSSYTPGAQAIEIGEQHFGTLAGRQAMASTGKSRLLHEAQHLVQELHGLDAGASPSDFPGVSPDMQRALYDTVGGENEAVATMRREKLTAAERRARHPEMDMTHPVAEQIPSPNGGGVNMGGRQMEFGGDLPKGYTVERKADADLARYDASEYTISHKGKPVGTALVTDMGKKVRVSGINIEPAHQRKGIATALYAKIESDAGKPLVPDESLSPKAYALWKKHRPEALKEHRLLKSGNAMRDPNGWFSTEYADHQPHLGKQAFIEPLKDLASTATDAWRRAMSREVVEGRPIRQRRLDPRKVNADPETFQFKSGGDQHGVTDRLKGVKEWDPLAAGKQIVYERANGEMVIADGHQRRGLALRAISAGQKGVMLDAFVLREKDGWSPADVRAYAALKNMKESSGNALDMAKVMRERPDLVGKASLPLSDTKIREAMALAKLSPKAFDMVASGAIKPEHAAAVGAQVGETSRHVDMLTEMAKAGMRSADHARLYVAQALAAPSISETTGSLFGEETNVRSLLAERAKVLDRALSTLKGDKRIFAMLEREAGNIEAAGNKLAHASNLERADTAGRLAELVKKLSTTRGPVSQMLDRAAMAMAEGKAPAQAARGFVTDVAKAMKEGGVNGLMGDAPAPVAAPADPNQMGMFGEDIRESTKNPGWSDEARAASAEVRKGKAKGKKQMMVEDDAASRKARFDKMVADTKAQYAAAEDAIRAAMEKSNTRLAATKNGLTTVLTRDPNGNGFRVTTLRDGEPLGHRDYPMKASYDMRELVKDMVLGGLGKPDKQMHIEDGKKGQSSMFGEPTTKDKIDAASRAKAAKGRTGDPMNEGLFGSSMQQTDLVDAIKAKPSFSQDDAKAAFGDRYVPGQGVKQEGYWTHKSGPTPTVADLPPGASSGSQKDFESLSPGMRREIMRSAQKLPAPKQIDAHDAALAQTENTGVTYSAAQAERDRVAAGTKRVGDTATDRYKGGMANHPKASMATATSTVSIKPVVGPNGTTGEYQIVEDHYVGRGDKGQRKVGTTVYSERYASHDAAFKVMDSVSSRENAGWSDAAREASAKVRGENAVAKTPKSKSIPAIVDRARSVHVEEARFSNGKIPLNEEAIKTPEQAKAFLKERGLPTTAAAYDRMKAAEGAARASKPHAITTKPPAAPFDPYASSLIPTAQRQGAAGLAKALEGMTGEQAIEAVKAQIGVKVTAGATDAETRANVAKAIGETMAQRAAAAGSSKLEAKHRAMGEEAGNHLRGTQNAANREAIAKNRKAKAKGNPNADAVYSLNTKAMGAKRADAGAAEANAALAARKEKLHSGSGLRGTQNEANREAIIANRKKNAKGPTPKADDAFWPSSMTAKSPRRAAAEAAERDLSVNTTEDANAARPAAKPKTVKELRAEAKAAGINVDRNDSKATIEAKLKRGPRSLMGDNPYMTPGKKQMMMDHQAAYGARQMKQAMVTIAMQDAMKLNAAKPSAPQVEAPAPVAKPSMASRAGHAFNVAGIAGIGAGIAAASVMAANEAHNEGKSTAEQVKAGATAGVVAAAPAAVVGGGLAAAAKWGGKTVAKAVPVVGWGIAAGAAALGAVEGGKAAAAEGKGAVGIAKSAAWGAVNSVVPIDAAMAAAKSTWNRVSNDRLTQPGQMAAFAEANEKFRAGHPAPAPSSDRKPGWGPEARIAAAKARGASTLPYGGDPTKAPGYVAPIEKKKKAS